MDMLAAIEKQQEDRQSADSIRTKLLQELASGSGDPEGAHILAEHLLVEYLRAGGDETLADAWVNAKEEQCWWYA